RVRRHVPRQLPQSVQGPPPDRGSGSLVRHSQDGQTPGRGRPQRRRQGRIAVPGRDEDALRHARERLRAYDTRHLRDLRSRIRERVLMASNKKSSSSKKQPSQGGGRTSNSEPRIQTFKDFAGCNFQQSQRAFEQSNVEEEDQSNLQMNYVVIQNNAGITDDRCIETRPELVELFSAPDGTEFTDVACLIDDDFHIACSDKSIRWGTVGKGLEGSV